MEFLHPSASIITVLTGLYTLLSIFTKKKKPSSSSEPTKKPFRLLNILSVLIISAALLFTASLAFEKQFPGTLAPQWTPEAQLMIPPSGKSGRHISRTITVPYPAGTSVLDKHCYYPDPNRTADPVLKNNVETNTYECTGEHWKHDNKRAIHLSVCYSRFKNRKCPPRK